MRSNVFFAAIFFLAGAMTPAAASGISLPMDEARVITFKKPVATVFVANPTVADINTIDATHVYLLGKAFGATNLIALDQDGKEMLSEHVTVIGSSHLITLNRGTGQFTFACATRRCEVDPSPGDVKIWHDDTMGEAERREDNGVKQASATEPHH